MGSVLEVYGTRSKLWLTRFEVSGTTCRLWIGQSSVDSAQIRGFGLQERMSGNDWKTYAMNEMIGLEHSQSRLWLVHFHELTLVFRYTFLAFGFTHVNLADSWWVISCH
jgi:hypothetical protein